MNSKQGGMEDRMRGRRRRHTLAVGGDNEARELIGDRGRMTLSCMARLAADSWPAGKAARLDVGSAPRRPCNSPVFGSVSSVDPSQKRARHFLESDGVGADRRGRREGPGQKEEAGPRGGRARGEAAGVAGEGASGTVGGRAGSGGRSSLSVYGS